MPSSLLLVRHGQSTWNAEGRWQGWSDPPLSELGREQAEDAAGDLHHLDITGVVSSDLARARDTAEILAAALDLGAPLVDRDLREYDVGDWEGLTRPEIERGWPDQLASWREGRLLATPGGETRAHFVTRVVGALGRAARRPDLGDTVLVVTHGGVIRAAEQVSGTERSAVIENLAGRWFTVDADGRLAPGELVNLLDTERRTTSPSL
ncbi:MAG TPA: histidine phosphatase family protein [Acidimicrobiales bacterium]|nr:histidine phosphatase family protein [Acidimicrobiales bacterium]